MSNMLRVQGTVNRILFQNDSWAAIIVLDALLVSFKCVGSFQHVEVGESVDFNCEPEVTSKYGLSYKVVGVNRVIPHTEIDLLQYLASGNFPGVGEGLAKRIIKALGVDAIKKIEADPACLKSVPRITPKAIKSLTEGTESSKKIEEIYKLTHGEVTFKEAMKIAKLPGGMKILTENPYRLIGRVEGLGFLKTDRIAMSCGMTKNDMRRMTAGLTYVLESIAESRGDCYVTVSDMEKEVADILNPLTSKLKEIRGFQKYMREHLMEWESVRSQIRAKFKALTDEDMTTLDTWVQEALTMYDHMAQAIDDAEKEGWIVVDGDTIASKRLYDTEQKIADNIHEIQSKPPRFGKEDVAGIKAFIKAYETAHHIEFAPEQKEGVVKSLTNRLSIICGGPGCGKTTVIQVIVAYWRKYFGDHVILMAPTGRAAQRIKEQIPDPGIESSTIHKATCCYMRTDAEIESDPDKPNNQYLVVCDESSMIDVSLAKTLSCYAKDATLLLVGDPDQLPPVGAGNFYRDLIMSGEVPYTKLVLGFRNAGLIASNAQKINHGSTDLDTGKDFYLNEMEGSQIAEAIKMDYLRAVKAGISPKDMTVLTLQRKRGTTSVNSLNALLQNAYNPLEQGDLQLKNCVFRIGDRVMQIKNNYNIEYTQNGKTGKAVFNGDVGTVSDIDTENGILTVTFDDGRIADYDSDVLGELELAYAMTVHKAQGSEYKLVLMAVCYEQYVMLNRAIIYTMATRAKKQERFYCERKALNTAIRTVGNSSRQTRLIRFLKGRE